MTKKILISLSVIGIIMAIVIGGTWAYFSDTEKSEGNTFSSGTMDFRIARPGTSPHKIFDVSNLKPGQVVEGYFAVVNDSTAELDMKWKAWVTGFNATTYSLDKVLEVKITLRPDDYTEYDNFTSVGYTIAGPENHPVTNWTHIHNLTSGNTILAWNYDCCESSSCANGHEPFRVKWAGIYKIEVRMQTTAGDNYQGESFTGDINFYATQCENTL